MVVRNNPYDPFASRAFLFSSMEPKEKKMETMAVHTLSLAAKNQNAPPECCHLSLTIGIMASPDDSAAKAVTIANGYMSPILIAKENRLNPPTKVISVRTKTIRMSCDTFLR